MGKFACAIAGKPVSLNMPLFVSSLNTGSNGNCFYIGNQHEAILLDAGLSCRETEIRMKRLNLSMSRVRAIFISHEHTDHIRGVSQISKKYRLPVYITHSTLLSSGISVGEGFARQFTSYQSIQLGSLKVIPFPKKHDAADPFGFTVCHGDLRVGVFTDIGTPCEHVIQQFRKCHAAFLESNYDEKMLEQGNYPHYLKKRIRGGSGHLSNRQALDLFLSHRPEFMSHLFLSHLSKNNNCPRLVEDIFRPHAAGTQIIVASRERETEVYRITGNEPAQAGPPVQLSLEHSSFL